MLHRLSVTCLLVGTQFLYPCFLQAQAPNISITRDQYLDKLEARHKDLSLELKAILGDAFVLPEGIIKPENPAQGEFDSLPGPIKSNFFYENNSTQAQTKVTTDSNESGDEPLYESEVVPPRFLEDEKGTYFIQPYVGLSVIGGDLKVGVDIPEMDADLGYSLGVRAGRRWGNLEGEIHVGYQYNSYQGDFVDSGSYYSVSGMVEATSLGTRLGYGVPFGDRGWYKGAIGFGFANRRHSNNVTIDSYAPPGESYAESVFTYNFMVAMGYQLEFGWDAILSYQYLTLGDYREFDDLSAHLFELGLGKNF